MQRQSPRLTADVQRKMAIRREVCAPAQAAAALQARLQGAQILCFQKSSAAGSATAVQGTGSFARNKASST